LSAWGRSARPQVEALRCHAGHGLVRPAIRNFGCKSSENFSLWETEKQMETST
jgi:hypothetical protein